MISKIKTMKKKILILKNESDCFEKFYSEHLRLKGCAVYAPYNDLGNCRYVIAGLNRVGINMLTTLALNQWKKNVDNYSKVIVFDYGLSKCLLKWLKAKVGKNNIRVWLWNVPNISVKWIKEYAKVYCFDYDFSVKNNIGYIHQFYFKNLIPEQSSEQVDVFYVGRDKGRFNFLDKLINVFKQTNLTYKIFLYKDNLNEFCDSNIITNKFMDYNEVISRVCSSKAIIEINLEAQTGITLRALEALYFKKKLITNNENIMNFNFYKPENIFIVGKDDINKLYEFVNSKWCDLPEDIYNQYSFEDWLNKITE